MKYELTEDPAIKMLIVSGAYITGIIIATDSSKVSLSPMNPAIAAALVFSNIITGNPTITGGIKDWEPNWSYIMCTFPFIGSLLATLLYEFLYKKSIDMVEAD